MNDMVHPALKTLRAIDDALEADQGAKFRGFLGKVIPHMKDAYRDTPEEGFRSHMGASGIGKECGRAIWYSFRWTTKPHFQGRMVRLFNRGHLEEARFIALLLTIGVQVFQQDADGNQFRISACGGHYGGSGDGVGIGIPDLPQDAPCLLEFKTHSEKSFLKVKAEGVRAAKFEHYVQMNQYMRKMNLYFALYGAVNKNTDEIYWEIVPLDIINADQFLDRAQVLVFSREAPTKISNSPGWFACKFCDHKAVCHQAAPPAINCRTCHYAMSAEDGLWYCENPVAPVAGIPKELQLTGCSHYEVF